MPWQPEAVALIDGEMYVKAQGEVVNIGEPPVEPWAIFAACDALRIPWGEFESCPEGEGGEGDPLKLVPCRACGLHPGDPDFPEAVCAECGREGEAQSVPLAHN